MLLDRCTLCSQSRRNQQQITAEKILDIPLRRSAYSMYTYLLLSPKFRCSPAAICEMLLYFVILRRRCCLSALWGEIKRLRIYTYTQVYISVDVHVCTP